jgi:Ser/Thr protein kinase RdoA (MazF antagonist)
MLHLAKKAAALWWFTVKSLALAAHRENAVFRLETEQGVYALRLHRVGYRSDEALRAEMDVVRVLASAGCSVPAPVASRAGDDLQILEGVQVTVLTWLEGVPLGETGKPFAHKNRLPIFAALGGAIAKMHNALDDWKPLEDFPRVHWNAEGLLGDHPHWGPFWDNPSLSLSEKNLVLKVRHDLQQRLQRGTWDYGYIHADLVSENLLVDGIHIRVVDFDDSGFGFRLQDIATALVKHHEEPDYVDLRGALVAGYQNLRPLDVGHVDMFLLIRRLSYLGWIIPRMGDAAGKARAERFLQEALAAAQAYVVAAK